MDLEKVFTVQGILLILTGVFLLVMGIKVVIRQTKIRKQDLIKEGTVLHSRHVEQRDKEGFLTENYYELRAEYHDKGHRMEKTVYSVEEYLEGDTIRLVKAPDNGKDVFIYKEDKANGIGAWVWIAAGSTWHWGCVHGRSSVSSGDRYQSHCGSGKRREKITEPDQCTHCGSAEMERRIKDKRRKTGLYILSDL